MQFSTENSSMDEDEPVEFLEEIITECGCADSRRKQYTGWAYAISKRKQHSGMIL